MAILGLIIVLAAGVFLANAFFSATDPASFSILGIATSMSVGQAVVLGAVAGLLFALGLGMLFGGIGRAARRRRETKQVVRSTRTEAEELRLENERLANELRERESTPTSHTTVAYPDEPLHTPAHAPAAALRTDADAHSAGHALHDADDQRDLGTRR